MFSKPTNDVAAPLLSSLEPNDRLPHLECTRPPPGLVEEWLPPLPKHLIVEMNASLLTLRHPGDLIGLDIHSVEDLWYCMDVYELLSQRKLKRLCWPSRPDETSFLFQYTCCQADCPFRLCYRRIKNPTPGTNPNQSALILPSDEGDNYLSSPDEYFQAHNCQPHSEWQVADHDKDEETERMQSEPVRGSGYCASTALMDALVTRYLLRERRKVALQSNLEQYYIPFRVATGIQTSQQRFLHGCRLFTQIDRTWPKYVDEDSTICDSVHGLWCLGIQSKGLPNTAVQFFSAGPAPIHDPTAPLWTTLLNWLWYGLRLVTKCLTFMVFCYTFCLALAWALGSIILVSAIRGAAHWNQIIDTMQNATDICEFEGWVSDRTQPLVKTNCCGRCLGSIYGQNYGAVTVVSYMEDDGADFSHEFGTASRLNTNCGLHEAVVVSMKRLANQWSHAFPSLAFSKKHGLWSRLGCGALGVCYLLCFAFYLVLTLLPYYVWTLLGIYTMLNCYSLWIAWTCSPPEKAWEDIQIALWSPRGCHDWFSTLTRVLVFRVWAMSLPKQLAQETRGATPRGGEPLESGAFLTTRADENCTDESPKARNRNTRKRRLRDDCHGL